METREWRWPQDKEDYQPGPWVDEPDKLQFVDGDTGLPCLIVRNRMGALCGYVGVSRGHPAYGKEYGDVDVSVHGGLTFSNRCQPEPKTGNKDQTVCHVVEPGEDDDVWWLGFDCAHAFDYVPSMDTGEIRRWNREHGFREDLYSEMEATYRDLEYVRREVLLLAMQLRAMA